MGNSTVSLKNGANYKSDNSLISKDNISATEEDKINMVCAKKRFLKQEKEESKNNMNYTNNNNDKVPTMFEWSFKGNSVYLTGSFCNWQEFFLMKKDENGIFRLILDLNRGFHQYKFKIDNEWKYNKNFPIYNDNGYINNYIDTSDWEIKGEYEKEEIDRSIFSISNTDFINCMKDKSMNKNLSEEFYEAMMNYGNYIPLENEMEKIAPTFSYIFIMNCINKNNEKKENKENKEKQENKENQGNQDNIIKNKISLFSLQLKKKKSSKNNRYKKENIYYNNDSNSMIIYNNKIMHDQLNHYHLKKIKCNNPLRSSIISRYRLKFTNFVYYK